MESDVPKPPPGSCALTLPEFIIYFYLQTGICVIGFILNIIICGVFRKPQFVGAAHKFMIALAVTDAITLIVTFPIGFQRLVIRWFHKTFS